MTDADYAGRLIDFLGLKPLEVEGGLFARTYESPEELPEALLPSGCRGLHPAATAILYMYLSEGDCFSALHALPSDEIYHFYLGSPVEMLLLHPEGKSERFVLGPEVLGGQRVQHIVPRGVWQGSCLIPGGAYALVGTTMAPGFVEGDYRGGEAEDLLRRYPAERDSILRLSRGSASAAVAPLIDKAGSRS